MRMNKLLKVWKLQNMACEKDWIDVLSALLTPIIAFVAVGIAVLQWKINRNRLKHELFDRRYEQYEAVQKFLGSIFSSGKVSVEAQANYLNGITGIEFTHSKELKDYLHKNVWCPAIDLECAQAEFDALVVGDERSRLVRKAANIKIKLREEMDSIDDVFRPYLHLGH